MGGGSRFGRFQIIQDPLSYYSGGLCELPKTFVLSVMTWAGAAGRGRGRGRREVVARDGGKR